MKATKEAAGVYNVKGRRQYTITKLEGHTEWLIFTAPNRDACTNDNNWGVGAATKREALQWIEEEDNKLK